MAEDALRTQVQTADDGGVAVSFEGRLSIWDVPTARDVLVDSIGRGAAVHLDLSGVEQVDLAGLQLLWSARRSAIDVGVDLRVERSSEPLRALSLAGGFAAIADEAMDLSVEG